MRDGLRWTAVWTRAGQEVARQEAFWDLEAAGAEVEILDLVGGVARPIAFSYTVVLHAALWIPITVLGLFFLYRERLNWSDVQRATEGDALAETDLQEEQSVTL